MSMAVKYGLMKKAKGAGSDAAECPGAECGGCDSPACMAEGGMVGGSEGGEPEDSDIIGRIMKQRMAKGGEVTADEDSADFDYLDQRSAGDEANYTGADSGDDLGNAEMDENDSDLIRRIMRSRAKSDRNPRPA